MVVRIKRDRSSQYQTSNWIRPDLRLAIYLRDVFQCLYCGRDLTDADPRDISLDHVLAKKDGGSNKPANLVTCCARCNSSKQDRPLKVFTGPERIAIIRRNVRRSITKYRKLAKAILNPETVWSDQKAD